MSSDFIYIIYRSNVIRVTCKSNFFFSIRWNSCDHKSGQTTFISIDVRVRVVTIEKKRYGNSEKANSLHSCRTTRVMLVTYVYIRFSKLIKLKNHNSIYLIRSSGCYLYIDVLKIDFYSYTGNVIYKRRRSVFKYEIGVFQRFSNAFFSNCIVK